MAAFRPSLFIVNNANLNVYVNVFNPLYSSKQKAKVVNKTVASVKSSSIKPGESYTWPTAEALISVPPVVTSRLEGCGIMTVGYIMQVCIYLSALLIYCYTVFLQSVPFSFSKYRSQFLFWGIQSDVLKVVCSHMLLCLLLLALDNL